MKKYLAIFLALTLLFSLAALVGCGKKQETPADGGQTQPAPDSGTQTETPPAGDAQQGGEEEATLIGLTFNMLSDSFCKWIADTVTDLYAEKNIEVVQMDGNNDTALMIEQMENFATMGCKQILVMPMDSDGLEDISVKLIGQGIQIVFLGVIPQNYEISGGVCNDQQAVGVEVGKLALAWLDLAYPDAPAGSVHTAAFMALGIAETKLGSEAMRDTVAADPRVEITYTSDGLATVDDAAEAAENAFMVDPEIRLFVCWTTDMGVGVNNIVLSRPGVKLEEYGIFCQNYTETAQELIDLSANGGDSCFRGVVAAGGGNPGESLFACSYDVLTGAVETPNYCWEPIFTINAVGYEVAA